VSGAAIPGTRAHRAVERSRGLARRAFDLGFGGALALAGALLAWSGVESTIAWRDPQLGGPAPARQAWRWHRALTPAYERWARERSADARAARLPIDDIAGTEWPLFGSVYYLRATENLDRAWQRAPDGPRPREYARGAIDACADLLADPVQAHWVMRHWGERDYLDREDVFYRMMLVDGLATQWRLLGASPHAELLRAQVDAFANELSASADGLLADYPSQTFPADVAAAWHAIRRADEVLGTDHRAAADAARRGFVDAMAPDGELPPYAWFGDPPRPTPVRGSANAWLLHHAPFLWPDLARTWSRANDRRYWVPSRWLGGYREYDARASDMDSGDVDSGPIVAGIGTAASAFGIGAARSVGDGERARTLALQAIAVSVPLPNGRLLLPRLASDATDAPLLGEAALLYNLTQPPAPGFDASPAAVDATPRAFWLVLALQVLGGLFLLRRGALRIARATRRRAPV